MKTETKESMSQRRVSSEAKILPLSLPLMSSVSLENTSTALKLKEWSLKTKVVQVQWVLIGKEVSYLTNL
jgi:hypothetical protein